MSKLAQQLADLGITAKILTVGDDETVVLIAPEGVTPEHVEEIRDGWADVFGDVRTVVTCGVQIAVARTEDALS